MPIISLTTDFRTGSPYVAAMKGVILAINPAATVVDLTHDVRPQDVRQGAMALDDVTGRFPAGTIHVAVVDPGVGTGRAIVYARIGQQQYVAPDNGLLSLVALRSPPARIVRVTDPAYWLHPVSRTFHGRDIMAPVAARLSLGLDPALLGEPTESLVAFDWPQPRRQAGQIEGQVLDVDSFGNLITNLTESDLSAAPLDGRTSVQIAGRTLRGIARAYGDHAPGTLIALFGSGARLEIAVVAGSAAQHLALDPGTPVTVQWPDRDAVNGGPGQA